jgi:hypothetical protein
MMGGRQSPEKVAKFLQSSAFRKELPRWLALSTSYKHLNPDPTTDSTINSINENPYPVVGSPYYVIPPYREVTPLEPGENSPDFSWWCKKGTPSCAFTWGTRPFSQRQILLYEKMTLGLAQVSLTQTEANNFEEFKRQKAKYQESILGFPTNLLDWLLETEEDKEVSQYLSDYQNILTDEELRQFTDEELLEHLKALRDHQFELFQIDLSGGLKNISKLGGKKLSGSGSAIGRFKGKIHGKIKPFLNKLPKFRVHMGRQSKHIRGSNNFIEGRSEWTHPDPQGLVDKFAGKGKQVGKISRGNPGFKEKVNFGENIGLSTDKFTPKERPTPTTYGTIHYSKKGVHIVPTHP